MYKLCKIFGTIMIMVGVLFLFIISIAGIMFSAKCAFYIFLSIVLYIMAIYFLFSNYKAVYLVSLILAIIFDITYLYHLFMYSIFKRYIILGIVLTFLGAILIGVQNDDE